MSSMKCVHHVRLPQRKQLRDNFVNSREQQMHSVFSREGEKCRRHTTQRFHRSHTTHQTTIAHLFCPEHQDHRLVSETIISRIGDLKCRLPRTNHQPHPCQGRYQLVPIGMFPWSRRTSTTGPFSPMTRTNRKPSPASPPPALSGRQVGSFNNFQDRCKYAVCTPIKVLCTGVYSCTVTDHRSTN